MNPKLFGAIVLAGIAGGVAGAALPGCRTGLLPEPDLGAPADLARADEAAPVDMAGGDLMICCVTGVPGPAPDLSGCIPITCILL